jgi:hypothetical protein
MCEGQHHVLLEWHRSPVRLLVFNPGHGTRDQNPCREETGRSMLPKKCIFLEQMMASQTDWESP